MNTDKRKVTKETMVAVLNECCHLPKRKGTKVVNTLIHLVQSALKDDMVIILRGIGRLETIPRKGCRVYDFQNHHSRRLPDGARRVRFVAGHQLKDIIKK